MNFIQENAFEIVVCQYGGHFVQRGDELRKHSWSCFPKQTSFILTTVPCTAPGFKAASGTLQAWPCRVRRSFFCFYNEAIWIHKSVLPTAIRFIKKMTKSHIWKSMLKTRITSPCLVLGHATRIYLVCLLHHHILYFKNYTQYVNLDRLVLVIIYSKYSRCISLTLGYS